jgi:hypothetical protein
MIDPASISTDPTTMPWKPLWAETKARVYGSWFAVVGFDLGKWTLGFAFDVAPTGFYIDLGPLFAGAERDEAPPKSYDHLPDWSWSLLRFVIQKWKIELRLELDLNIWRLGYIMADMHDHGLYVGPFNLQIEYNKLYAYPDLTLATVQHAFFEWLDTARPRLKIPMELRALTGRQIELAFVGINSAIGATLTTRELSVFVEWEGRIWDFFRCFDVWPRLAIGGYICEHCRPEQRTIFPCMQALWQDHLFEPLLEWINGKLAAADAVGLYGSTSSGWTHAELLSDRDPQRSEPDIRLPLRVQQQQNQ